MIFNNDMKTVKNLHMVVNTWQVKYLHQFEWTDAIFGMHKTTLFLQNFMITEDFLMTIIVHYDDG